MLPAVAAADAPDGRARPGPVRQVLIAARTAAPGFLQGVTEAAREHGWRLTTDMLHTGAIPHRWKGDGILSFTTTCGPLPEHLVTPEIPHVRVSLAADCHGLPRVEPDNFAIGQLAAQHLLDRHYRKFLWAPFQDDPFNQERLRGFHALLPNDVTELHRLPPAYRRLGEAWNDNSAEWRDALIERLTLWRGQVGVFAFNDCLAARIVAVARDEGFSVPEDLAIIGVGNTAWDCDSAAVSLTSIDLDLPGMTRFAATLLDEALSQGRCADKVWLYPPGEVVTRASTPVHQLHGSRLHQAVAYIAAHTTDPALDVAAVAANVGISRRQLERDFRKLKGCTIRGYIEDTRMEAAARLVVEHPDTKVLAVAEAIGITDPNSFFRKFRKRFGTTPAAFRRRFATAETDPLKKCAS